MIKVILLVMSVFASPAFALDSSIRISGLSFPPYIIHKEGQAPSGIVVDLVSMALKEKGYKLDFRISNWARAFAEIKAKQVDAIIPTMKSKDREEFLYFPEQQVLNLDLVLVAAKKHTIPYDGTLDSVRSYSFGRIRDARISPEFDAARERGEIKVYERVTAELLIKAAALGRLDLVALPKVVALASASKLSMRNKITILEPSLNSTPIYIAFSKANVPIDLAQDVSEILRRYHSDGTHNEVVARYLAFGD